MGFCQWHHSTQKEKSISKYIKLIYTTWNICPQVKKSVHMLECTVQSLVIKWMVPIVLVTSNNPIVIPKKKIFKLCDMCHNGKGNMKDLFSIFHNYNTSISKSTALEVKHLLYPVKEKLSCVVIILNVSGHWVGLLMTSSCTYSWMHNMKKN